MESEQKLIVIALVGRPNVGKSTIFNKLTKSKKALVADVPGTTRDRKEGLCTYARYRFQLIDTGGLPGKKDAFSEEIQSQIEKAVRYADMIWFVLDGKDGLNPFDPEIYISLKRSKKPIKVIINKEDSAKRKLAMGDFYKLGADELYPVSGLHGYGFDSVLEDTSLLLPEIMAPIEDDSANPALKPIRIAFVGKPNVGKSSLVNQIIGDDRMIVSEISGTTRESVELPFEVDGKPYILVDTAGLRKRAKTKEYLDKISSLNALGALNLVDVAVLVIDGTDEISGQDARIAREILDHQRAVVIALSKCDAIGSSKKIKEVETNTLEKLRFIDFANVVKTSSVNGSGIAQLFKEINRASEQFNRKIVTSDINRVVESALLRFPPPARGRSQTKIYYGLQKKNRPPTFMFYSNHVEKLSDAYTRFFENQLRHHFGLNGTPIKVQWVKKKEGKARRRTG